MPDVVSSRKQEGGGKPGLVKTEGEEGGQPGDTGAPSEPMEIEHGVEIPGNQFLNIGFTAVAAIEKKGGGVFYDK